MCSHQSVTHWATNQRSLYAVCNQGTRNLTVLGSLSGSWVSHEGLKGEAQTGWNSRLWSKKGRPCKQWWAGHTGITDLISWCRCGGRRASLSPLAPWDRGLVSHGLVSWQLGPSGSSQQSYPVCWGLFLPGQGYSSSGSLLHLRLREYGDMGWQSSHEVSRHSWLRTQPWIVGCLPVCVFGSLVSGLGPWCQPDWVGTCSLEWFGTHSLEWVRLLLQTLRKGTG